MKTYLTKEHSQTLTKVSAPRRHRERRNWFCVVTSSGRDGSRRLGKGWREWHTTPIFDEEEIEKKKEERKEN